MSMIFLQLSDLHLAPPGQRVVGIDPLQPLQRVLARITQLAVAPAFIVVSGDLTEANSALFGGTLHATAPAVLRQLDYFAGAQYTTVPGAGFNLCQLDDAGLIVHPVLLP